MAKQTFSVGQVLTAAQMTSLQQTAMLGGSATAKTTSYTLVAADAGTVVSVNSTSATTITVNTGLFAAGDVVTIQNWGSGAVTITAGTATVNTAGSLIVPQYDGGVLYFTSTSAAIYFDWVQAGATSPLTTKGDIWGYSTSDARIPIGTDGQILTADSTQSLGLKWATAASGGGMTLISEQSASSSAGIDFTSISGSYKQLHLVFSGAYHGSGNTYSIRFNSDSGANYAFIVARVGATGVSRLESATDLTDGNNGITPFGYAVNSSTDYSRQCTGFITIDNYASTSKYKTWWGIWSNTDNTNANYAQYGDGVYKSLSAITAINIVRIGGSTNLTNAANTSIRLYGIS